MCRLDRISAHLETFHRLTWICRDQNPCLSASCEVGELSADITPRCGPGARAGFAGAGAKRVRLRRWRGEAVTASSLCRVVLALPSCSVLCPSQIPKMFLICSLVARSAPTAGREWIAPLFLNFPPDAPYKWNLPLGSRQAAVWVCRGKAQSLRRGQDLSHPG